MIPVLFARKDSIYKELGCDAYDVHRDARSWGGGTASICHPPCRGWSALSHMSKADDYDKSHAVWSVNMVRKYGGVVEHPRASKLWKEMNLPAPGGNGVSGISGSIDEYGGFSILVRQFDFGHKIYKPTLLYIVGLHPDQLPSMPFKCAQPYHVFRKRKSHPDHFREITKAEREHTPVDFAKWLIEVVKQIEENKNK